MKYADMRQKTVLFDVFDWDRFSRDDRIGQVQLNLDVIDFSKTHEGWKDLSVSDLYIHMSVGESWGKMPYYLNL